MSKTTCCIQMLQLLRVNGVMSRQDLAGALQTNIRNIGEYKKELEEAGYHIDTTPGPKGGYYLVQGSILPSLRFKEGERLALQEGRKYIQSHPGFVFQEAYDDAMIKVLSSYEHEEKEEAYYVRKDAQVDSNMQAYLKIVQEAIDMQLCLSITYQGLKDEVSEIFTIHPYRILYYHEAYYVIAYAPRRKGYRFYRFSKERMHHIEESGKHFAKDEDFKLYDHMGKLGLVKSNTYEIELFVKKGNIAWLKEHPIGYDMQIEDVKDGYKVFTIIEGEYELFTLLFTRGDTIQLVKPRVLIERLQERIQQLQKSYTKDF